MNKKAFTLIELLAVIIILGIIALITVPNISKIISNSRANSFRISLEQLLKVAQSDYQSNARIGEIKYTLADNVLTCTNCSEGQITLKFSGDMKDASGNLTINDTAVTMDISNAIYNGVYEQKEDKDKGKIGKVVVTRIRTQSDLIKDNLITNGYGDKNSTSNFTNLDWDATNKNFYTTTSTRTDINSAEYIPIDPHKTYFQSATVKSNNSNAVYYMGFREFDVDKKEISCHHNSYIPGSLTTLAKDLNNGDTTIYLASTAGFNNTTTDVYKLGLIFWNYQDSKGKKYAQETYSRNAWTNLYLNTEINNTNNTITLKKAWDKGTIKAGTKVSQSSNISCAYNYGILTGTKLANAWTTYTNKVAGFASNNTNKQFRYATKYIKFYTINNYKDQPDSTLYMKDLIFEEFVED